MTLVMVVVYFIRKMCQPELDTAPQESSMPKLSSTNLLRKEVTEETAKVRTAIRSECVCLCVRVYMCVCVHARVLMCMCVYVCMHKCVHMRACM